MKKHIFIYNDMISQDFGLTVSGEDTWTRPQPDLTRISVPGRNGDLIQLGNRYKNLNITYHCGIIENLRVNFDAFNASLLASPGYHKLEDSYHSEYFRMAVFESALEPDVKKRGIVGEVDITFNCKPQMFLKSGQVEQAVQNSGILYNPTPYPAYPLVRFYASQSWVGGSITINGRTVTFTEIGTVDDIMIDCERQDIYKVNTKTNMNNTFNLEEFFELSPGRNSVVFAGIRALYITPNWWTL